MQRALLSLKPEWRLIVIFKEIDGLSYEEIADRMNCSTGTVASRLNRSRLLLAQKLEHLREPVLKHVQRSYSQLSQSSSFSLQWLWLTTGRSGVDLSLTV